MHISRQKSITPRSIKTTGALIVIYWILAFSFLGLKVLVLKGTVTRHFGPVLWPAWMHLA
jgi:hypothetical protein